MNSPFPRCKLRTSADADVPVPVAPSTGNSLSHSSFRESTSAHADTGSRKKRFESSVFIGLTMDSLSPSQLQGLKSEELMDQIRQQLAIANAQLVIQKMTEKCFAKCISKPGSSLDNSEQKCVAMCMDRYMDSHSVVSTAYLNRLRQ